MQRGVPCCCDSTHSVWPFPQPGKGGEANFYKRGKGRTGRVCPTVLKLWGEMAEVTGRVEMRLIKNTLILILIIIYSIAYNMKIISIDMYSIAEY